MNNNIYDMKLHGRIEVAPGNFIMRVLGGWLYTLVGYEGKFTTTFVPFNIEFIGLLQ